MKNLVDDIDHEVRNTFRYKKDPINKDIWGNVEFEFGKRVGDCEEWADYAAKIAVSKYAINPNDVSFFLCDTKKRVGKYDHAICMIRTPDGVMTCGDCYDKFPRYVDKYIGYSFFAYFNFGTKRWVYL